MKRYLIASIICFLIALRALLHIACGPLGIKPTCKQDALYAAMTYQPTHYVRIAYGPIWDDPGASHMQAQALIDGAWTWLCLYNGYVTPCAQDYFVPKYVATPEQVFRVIPRKRGD